MKLKKIILQSVPYVVVGLLATKLGQGWRLAEGVNASEKMLNLMAGIGAAFQSPLPSFHPLDLFIGLLCGGFLRLAVYLKSQNAKKYRKGMEYGSARWGTTVEDTTEQPEGDTEQPDTSTGTPDIPVETPDDTQQTDTPTEQPEDTDQTDEPANEPTDDTTNAPHH